MSYAIKINIHILYEPAVYLWGEASSVLDSRAKVHLYISRATWRRQRARAWRRRRRGAGGNDVTDLKAYMRTIHTHTGGLSLRRVKLFEPRLYVIVKHSLVGMPMNMLHSWYSVYMKSPLSIQSFQAKGITGVKLSVTRFKWAYNQVEIWIGHLPAGSGKVEHSNFHHKIRNDWGKSFVK